MPRYSTFRTGTSTPKTQRRIKTFFLALASSTVLVIYLLYFPSVPHPLVNARTSTFETIARTRLAQLQGRYTTEEVFETTGLKTGNFSWDFYEKEIRSLYQEFFMPSSSSSKDKDKRQPSSRLINAVGENSTIYRVSGQLANSLNLLSYGRNASARKDYHHYVPNSFPHTIYTTSKETSLPEQFSTWYDLNSRAGWQIRSYNDDDIWQWVVDVFGRNGGETEGNVTETRASPLVVDVYKQISNGVLRGDVFRYLALLMEGGIYTDTDTACIRPIIRWPGIRESHWDLKDITDSLLTSLPHMEDLLMQAEQEGVKYTVLPGGAKPMEVKVTPSEAIWDRMAKLKLDAWDPPRLVVGVEFDDWGPSATEHWSKGSLARGMQIVQSTMMAQPGHPVFVDVLGRIMKDIQNGRGTYADDIVDESGKKKVLSAERLMDILDFTGPGVFSDAVFRYLLARWGVHPKDLTKADGPMRIGDVLLYPLNSFTSKDGYYDSFQGEHRLVWHQFRGSWKGW